MPVIAGLSWIPLKDGASQPNPADFKDYPIPKGITAAYNGKNADANDPPAYELVSIWESEEAAKASKATPESAKFHEAMDQLSDTTDPAKRAHHNLFHFSNDFAPVAAAPIVEQTVFFVPTTVDKAAFSAAWEGAIKGWTPPAGWVAGTSGWGVDEDENPAHLGPGKSYVFMVAAGWESIEQAKATREASQASFKALDEFGITPERVKSYFNTFTKAPKP